MQVACPHCQTKLQLSAAKLPDTPFAIKCPKCETTFQVTPPAPEPPAAVTTPPEPVAPVVENPAPPVESQAAAAPAPPAQAASAEAPAPAPRPEPPPAQAAAAATAAPTLPPAQNVPSPIAPPVEKLSAPSASPKPAPPAPVMQAAAPPQPPAATSPMPPPPTKRTSREDELVAGKGTIPNMSVGWTHSMPSPTISDDTSSLVSAPMGGGDLLQTLAALLSGAGKQHGHHPEQVRKRNIVACLSSQEDLILLHNVFNGLAYELMVAGSVEEVTGMLQSGNQLDILLLDPNYLAEQQGCPSIMRYINMLNPARRRRLYVGIISQSYRTLDTQTAFANGVNVIVNSADLEQLPVILTKSILDFNNLYRAYNIASGTSPF